MSGMLPVVSPSGTATEGGCVVEGPGWEQRRAFTSSRSAATAQARPLDCGIVFNNPFARGNGWGVLVIAVIWLAVLSISHAALYNPLADKKIPNRVYAILQTSEGDMAIELF